MGIGLSFMEIGRIESLGMRFRKVFYFKESI